MPLGHSTSTSSDTWTETLSPLFLKHQALSSVALTPMLDYDDRPPSESEDSTTIFDSESDSRLSDSEPASAAPSNDDLRESISKIKMSKH